MTTSFYDELERLAQIDYPSPDADVTFTYDALGRRLSMTDGLGTTSWNYTNIDQPKLITDPYGTGISYDYDPLGNRTALSYGSNSYSYQYRCNGESIGQFGCESDRVSQTVNGMTTNYVLDSASPLTQVLQDGTNTYVYGVDRIAQINGTVPEYFLTDGLGSVRQLVDSTGNVTLAKSYQPYGTEASSAGSGLSSYGFTSEYTSQGLVYLRSRTYSPLTARFHTRDSWMGDYNRPLSLNRWMYVEGNPVNRTDPTGHHDKYPTMDDGLKIHKMIRADFRQWGGQMP